MPVTAVDSPMVLTPGEIDRAAESARELSAQAAARGDLPAEAVRLVAGLLDRLAAGRVVTLVPEHAELAVPQVADLLLVSQPFVTALIDRGELSAHAVGTARFVSYRDAMAYKRRVDAERRAALVELTQLSQELGLY